MWQDSQITFIHSRLLLYEWRNVCCSTAAHMKNNRDMSFEHCDPVWFWPSRFWFYLLYVSQNAVLQYALILLIFRKPQAGLSSVLIYWFSDHLAMPLKGFRPCSLGPTIAMVTVNVFQSVSPPRYVGLINTREVLESNWFGTSSGADFKGRKTFSLINRICHCIKERKEGWKSC